MCALTDDDRACILEVLRTHASCIEHATPPPHPRMGPAYGPHYAAHIELGVRVEAIADRLMQPCNCNKQ